jgi:hypothetical protein
MRKGKKWCIDEQPRKEKNKEKNKSTKEHNRGEMNAQEVMVFVLSWHFSLSIFSKRMKHVFYKHVPIQSVTSRSQFGQFSHP